MPIEERIRGRSRRRDGGRDPGVASVVGELLLIAMVVSVVGAVALGIPIHKPADRHRGLFDTFVVCGENGWATGDERVGLRHHGGEPVAFEHLRIDLRGPGIADRSFVGDAQAAGAVQMGTGAAWTTPNLTIARDAGLRLTVLYDHPGSVPEVLQDVAVSRIECELAGVTGGTFVGGFGDMPFLDMDCDTSYDVGQDVLVPVLDLSDGYYQTPPGICLMIPAAAGALRLAELELRSPDGGVISEADLMTTAGGLVIDAPGGFVDLGDVTVSSYENLVIRADDVILEDATLLSPDGTITVRSGAGGIDASGATIRAEKGRSGPPPTVDLPDQSGPGSVRFCIVVVDANDLVTDGEQYAGVQFTLKGRNGPSFEPGMGVLPETRFTTPLSLNADLLFSDGIADAQCVTYNDLEIGHWYYDTETRTGAGPWATPLYNDILAGTLEVLTDFFPYSGELFTPSTSDDDSRNQNADGDIHLTSGRPYRTMVVLNRFNDVRAPDILLHTPGGPIRLDNATLYAGDSDIVLDTVSGGIHAWRLTADVEAQGGQFRSTSGPGRTLMHRADIESLDGRVSVHAHPGLSTMRSAVLRAHTNLEISGGGDIDVRSSRLTSTDADLVLDVVAGTKTIWVQGATFVDRNNRADTRPSSAVVVGTPASGGTE